MTPSKFSGIIAVILAFLVAGWLLSGQIFDATSTTEPVPGFQRPVSSTTVARVQTRKIKAQTYIPSIFVTGQTESSRAITIRTQITGKISKTIVNAGDSVSKGDVIAQLNPEDLPILLKEAEARVKQRKIEFSAAKKLSIKGFKTETKLAAAFADLQSAKAHAKRVKIDYENTIIRAPFSGILSERLVENGDVLKRFDPIAELIDLDPLIITAYVSEKDYLKIVKGQSAKAKLRSGREIEGQIRFISPVAQKNTRTFKIELETKNFKVRIAEGITTKLIIPMLPIFAHQLPASLFSLNKDGLLGVKIVNAENKVKFIPINIVGDSDDKVFVTGLPDTCEVIVVGQGFVMDNEIVKTISEAQLSDSQQ